MSTAIMVVCLVLLALVFVLFVAALVRAWGRFGALEDEGEGSSRSLVP